MHSASTGFAIILKGGKLYLDPPLCPCFICDRSKSTVIKTVDVSGCDSKKNCGLLAHPLPPTSTIFTHPAHCVFRTRSSLSNTTISSSFPPPLHCFDFIHGHTHTPRSDFNLDGSGGIINAKQYEQGGKGKVGRKDRDGEGDE